MVEMLMRKEIPLKRNEIGGLVISPTRELAIQTHKIATTLCEAVELPKVIIIILLQVFIFWPL
jgi:superfamily II DNA/RNA helicase